MTPSPLDRPLAPLISSLLDAAHESHADRKLQHPKTQQYAMFEWQLQEAAAERSQQQRSGRSRRQTEDNVSVMTAGATGISGGCGSSAGFGARPRRQTDTSLSFIGPGGGASKGLLQGMQQRTSSASGMSLFEADEGGMPTCNLEVSQLLRGHASFTLWSFISRTLREPSPTVFRATMVHVWMLWWMPRSLDVSEPAALSH